MSVNVVCVTAIPAPYREKIYQAVSRRRNGDFHVIYCHKREPNRLWDVELGTYSRSFLRESFFSLRDVYVHINFDIWTELNRLDPKLVITTGYNPTFLIAFFWCLIKGRKHIPFTDGWLKSEEHLTQIHFLARKLIFRQSAAFIGASRHSLDLFRHYGCAEQALFQSHLCVDNEYFKGFLGSKRNYDVLFSGQFIKRKMPLFFAKVVRLLKIKKPDLRVLLLGDGPDREALLEAMRTADIDFTYAGYVSQAKLPAYYASAKLLLFPSLQDPWGVVANEACAAGVPVITCPNAGVADDLILHGYNGFVVELDAESWRDHALQLLNDDAKWNAFSVNALKKVQDYNYDVAAQGILKAIEFCGV
jgi:glycosyltransferase involved in cell wall biosynthesis